MLNRGPTLSVQTSPPSLHKTTDSRSASASALTLESDDVIAGLEAVKKSVGLHGIPASHLEALMQFAKEHNVVIAFRQVNPLSTSLIEAGYPTKTLEIKAKSADEGPLAGFIPVNQALSKNAGNPEKIKKYNAEVDKCIKEKHAEAIPLALDEKRLAELEKAGKIKIFKAQGSPEITITSKDGSSYKGILSSGDGQPRTYQIMHNGAPLQVLGKALNNGKVLPITADYDIMMFAPHIQDYGSQDMVRSSSRGRGSATFLQNTLNVSSPLASLIRRNSSTTSLQNPGDQGFISRRLEDMIPLMNKALGREPDNPLIHHGADTSNPYSDLNDNIPCTFFFPGKVGGIDGVAVAKTTGGLQELFKQAKNDNYQFFGNEKWERALNSEKYTRENFGVFRDVFAQQSSSRSKSLSRSGSQGDLLELPEVTEGHEHNSTVPPLRRRMSAEGLSPTELSPTEARGRTPRLPAAQAVPANLRGLSPSEMSPIELRSRLQRPSEEPANPRRRSPSPAVPVKPPELSLSMESHGKSPRSLTAPVNAPERRSGSPAIPDKPPGLSSLMERRGRSPRSLTEPANVYGSRSTSPAVPTKPRELRSQSPAEPSTLPGLRSESPEPM